MNNNGPSHNDGGIEKDGRSHNDREICEDGSNHDGCHKKHARGGKATKAEDIANTTEKVLKNDISTNSNRTKNIHNEDN